MVSSHGTPDDDGVSLGYDHNQQKAGPVRQPSNQGPDTFSLDDSDKEMNSCVAETLVHRSEDAKHRHSLSSEITKLTNRLSNRTIVQKLHCNDDAKNKNHSGDARKTTFYVENGNNCESSSEVIFRSGSLNYAPFLPNSRQSYDVARAHSSSLTVENNYDESQQECPSGSGIDHSLASFVQSKRNKGLPPPPQLMQAVSELSQKLHRKTSKALHTLPPFFSSSHVSTESVFHNVEVQPASGLDTSAQSKPQPQSGWSPLHCPTARHSLDPSRYEAMTPDTGYPQRVITSASVSPVVKERPGIFDGRHIVSGTQVAERSSLMHMLKPVTGNRPSSNIFVDAEMRADTYKQDTVDGEYSSVQSRVQESQALLNKECDRNLFLLEIDAKFKKTLANRQADDCDTSKC